MNISEKQYKVWKDSGLDLEDLRGVLKHYIMFREENGKIRALCKYLGKLDVPYKEVKDMTFEEGLTYVYLFS